MAGSVDISVDMVERLIADQFPPWAELPVSPIRPGGWDNRSFRLGETMIARLPSAEIYVPQVNKEQYWLPKLGPQLPLAIPEPLAMGKPGPDFPWPWSVYRWITGEPATRAAITDLSGFAATLADFLAALQRQDISEGPAPGTHNFYRGGSLAIYDSQAREALHALSGTIDIDSATSIWGEALASSWDEAPCWLHGDIAPGNLLVRDGVLTAVIDFGCCAIGDPACDLAIAWSFFDSAARDLFRARLAPDPGCWARGRGWALWKALIILAELPGTNPAERAGAAATLDRIIADWRGTG